MQRQITGEQLTSFLCYDNFVPTIHSTSETAGPASRMQLGVHRLSFRSLIEKVACGCARISEGVQQQHKRYHGSESEARAIESRVRLIAILQGEGTEPNLSLKNFAYHC